MVALTELCDRMLYPRRHLAVRARLAATVRPRRILVVCLGNVCRSPYLQRVLQRHLPDVEVASAGLAGSDRPVPQIAVALAAERGLDLAGFRSRPVTQTKVRDADLVIVMDSQQADRISATFGAAADRIIVAGDLDPSFPTRREIPDPWNKSAEAYAASFDRLDRCAAALAGALQPPI